jgi:hypothetical protein
MGTSNFNLLISMRGVSCGGLAYRSVLSATLSGDKKKQKQKKQGSVSPMSQIIGDAEPKPQGAASLQREL